MCRNHVDSTGEIDYFKILNEFSVSSGIRRVEAITGKAAEKFVLEKNFLVDDIKEILKANDQNLLDKLKNLKEENINLKKNKTIIKDLYSDANNIQFGDIKIYYQNLDCEPKELKNNSDNIKSKLIVVL